MRPVIPVLASLALPSLAAIRRRSRFPALLRAGGRAFAPLLLLLCLLVGRGAQGQAGNGQWKVQAQYVGTGFGHTASNGAEHLAILYLNTNQVTPDLNGNVDLSLYPNTPTDTLSGSILATFIPRTVLHAKNGAASGIHSAGGPQIRFTLTWQPRNGDLLADPPPAAVRFYYKRKINMALSATAVGVGTRCYLVGNVSCGPLEQQPESLEVLGTGNTGVLDTKITTVLADPAPQYADLPVSPQGNASFAVDFLYSMQASVDAPDPSGGGGGGGGGGTTLREDSQRSPIVPNKPIPPIPLYRMGDADGKVNVYVDYAVEGITLARNGALGGGLKVQSSDPSYTRWLPLSFSPTLDSQPMRTVPGALPAPWGNIHCNYSLALKEEPTTFGPTYDLFGALLRYLPPAMGPVQTTGNTRNFVPRYSLTDAAGNRLVWNSAWTPYDDVHSTLTAIAGGYQLTNAGPPNALAAKGPYTYTFQTIQTAPLVARLTAIADDHGNTQTLTWNGSLTVTDSSTGRQLVFSGSPYFTRVDAPAYGGQPGIYTTLTGDGAGHLTTLRVYPQAGGAPHHETLWPYGGPNGDSITSETQGGRTTAYTYVADPLGLDAFGLPLPRLASAAEGSAGDTTSSDDGGSVQGVYSQTIGTTQWGYSYWGVNSRTNTLTDARGNVFTLVYTVAGGIYFSAINALTAQGPDFTGAPPGSNVWKTTYAPDIVRPTQITLTDPFNHAWPATLDADGNVTAASDPLGHTWQFGYTPDGLHLTSITDPTGPIWQFGYTGSRLTSVTGPEGQTRATFAYNPFGQPTTVTVPAAVSASGQNEVTQCTYDPVTGDVIRITGPQGDVLTVNAYDALGDPLSVSVYPDTGDPATSQTPLTAAMVWDAAQQMAQALLPNGVQVLNTWTNGRVTQTRAQSPGGLMLAQMSFAYDSRGRLYAASDLVGSAAQYRYDKNSNLRKVLDGRGNVTQFVYGPCNEPTGVIWPGGQATSALYDRAGRVGSTTDERGIVALYLYDNAGRLTDLQFPAYPASNLAFTYDNADRPLTITGVNKSATFAYDPTSKRLSSLTTLTDGFSYTVSYTYYPDGKRASMTSPLGTTTYAYDADGHVSTLTDPSNQTTTWSYDHAGRPLNQISITRQGVSIATVFTYGPSGQGDDPSTAPAYLRCITQTVNGQLARQYTLTHSSLGQVRERTGIGPNGYTESALFGYDTRGRLTSETETLSAGGQVYNGSGLYQYDLADNLQGGLNGWTYDSNNRLTNAPPMGGLPGATGLAHDASGNMTALNGLTLTYDAWGQMVSAGTTTYTYDVFGRRAGKTVSGQTTRFLYDGENLVGEINGAGSLTHGYTWGPSGPVSDRLLDGQGNSVHRFCLPDDLGDSRLLVDELGQMSDAQAFQAVGTMLIALQPTTPMPISRGGYRDGETGLVYGGGSTYYAPSVGRFTTPSAPGYAGGGNPYAYAPPVEEPPDAWVLPDDPSGRQFYYDDFRRTVNRGAGLAKDGLNIASTFNPLCLGVQVWTGEDATGRKMGKGERLANLAMLAAGPVPHGVGALAPKINLLPRFAKAKMSRLLGKAGEARVLRELVEEGHELIMSQVYVNFSNGKRGILDHLVRLNSGEIVSIEVKNGLYARNSYAQEIYQQLLASEGGILSDTARNRELAIKLRLVGLRLPSIRTIHRK